MQYAFYMFLGLVCINTCLAKEKERVTVSYVLGPPKPLPEGLKAVAVINSGVETRGAKEDKRERKWSTMAADMIEAMLADGSTRFQSGLKVAHRQQTQAILKEQDLKLAGLVEGDAATKAGKLLDVQGLIVSRITINIDIEKGTKSTLDWGSLLGNMAGGADRSSPPPRPAPNVRVYPGSDPRGQRMLRYQRYYGPQYAAPPPQAAPVAPSGGLQTKEVEEVNRHITVQCSFSLIDAVTGGAIVQYSPPPIQKHDSSSPDFLFGGMIKPGELDPVDQFIGELVERATHEFVSTIVPTEVEYTYTVVGKSSAGEKGVRLLRAEDYAGALEQFSAECRKKPDEHETLFALGVASELLGDHAKALEYYRQAAAGDADKEELAMYVSAKKRLSEHLPRIMKPVSDTNPKPDSPK